MEMHFEERVKSMMGFVGGGVNERARWLLAFYGLVLVVLLGRTLYLQTVRRSDLADRSDDNRLQLVVETPTRGRIWDRGHRLIVDNRLSWTVSLSATPGSPADSTLRQLAPMLGLDPEAITDRLTAWQGPTHNPVPLLSDAPFQTVARIYESASSLPGVSVGFVSRRRYPFGRSAVHLLGYLRQIDSEELREHRATGHGYVYGDLIGRRGLEAAWERELRGRVGFRYQQVDVRGRIRAEAPAMPKRSPEHGRDLITTLDMQVQRAAEAAFPAGARGAVVALDPQTGAVLALASFPSFDPRLFSGTISEPAWNGLAGDSASPLLDRTIAGAYPPASIMKILTALAGLEKGVIDRDTLLEPCELPGWRLGRRIYRCWKPHGRLAVVQAIARSCDVFFYQVGIRVGLDSLHEVGRRFGLGDATGLGLPGEQKGILPDAGYYDQRLGRGRWQEESLVVNLAIGQGELLVTPLQIAVMTAAVANEGWLVTPYLVQADHPLQEQKRRDRSPTEPVPVPDLDSTALEIVRQGMLLAVEDSEGTARSLSYRTPGIRMAGKTGTAQNPLGADHAWFTGFAPFVDPEIVVTVLVENAGNGSAVALPVAAEVLRRFFALGTPRG